MRPVSSGSQGQRQHRGRRCGRLTAESGGRSGANPDLSVCCEPRAVRRSLREPGLPPPPPRLGPRPAAEPPLLLPGPGSACSQETRRSRTPRCVLHPAHVGCFSESLMTEEIATHLHCKMTIH
ncbi:hypothetical protein NDU88_000142 [Pleurodeles waltl]|uniref:Uncharacterized protein n=1 Tax=Pleurodeles waltl TaxID=8319 RepID=A0AAV7R3C2_PLEWA|nr:hypothetical protein NDU88_000142 [Pleurodeles waltl]